MKNTEFWNIYPDFSTKKLNKINQQGLFVGKKNQRHYS